MNYKPLQIQSPITFTSGHGLVNLRKSAILGGGIDIEGQAVIRRVLEIGYEESEKELACLNFP